VVSVGETGVVPLRATAPIPGSIAQVSALVEVQVSVEDSPVRIVSGFAEIFTAGKETILTVAVSGALFSVLSFTMS